jgi:hypothetical protein
MSETPETPKKKKTRKYHPPVKQDRSLIDVSREFATEEQCVEYLEKMRWPEGVTCLKCGHDRISKFTTNETTRKRFSKKLGREVEVKVPARHLYNCLNKACKFQFSPTTGTVFHDSHLPLAKWFEAIALMGEAKKGISAMQVQRHLKIGSYRTAWHLNHRIRKAMQALNPTDPLTGTVEVDETYIGAKRYDKRVKRGKYEKAPVFGMVERGGNVRTWAVPNVNRFYVIDKIKEGISIEADLIVTDESQLYKRMPTDTPHEIVNHSEKEWVRGNIHTGTIDGYWGLLKRGIIGSSHKVSIKHLHRYLTEFEYRWNNRKSTDMFEQVIIGLLIQSALEYAVLTSKKKVSLPASSEPSDEDLIF